MSYLQAMILSPETATFRLTLIASCLVYASRPNPVCDSQVFGAWSQWSECGQTCGDDFVTRSRTCIQNCNVAACPLIPIETECCLSISTCGTCPDNSTHVIATSTNSDFTLVNKKNPPTGNVSDVLLGSGQTLNHDGNTIYEFILSNGSLFEVKKLCIQTNARFVILGLEDEQLGTVEFNERINDGNPSNCVCWQNAKNVITKTVALKLLNGGHPLFARNLFISACACPPKPVVTRPPCGVSQVPNAGISGGHLPQQNIYFGYDALRNEFPWQVGLYDNGHLFCGGVIIDTLYILTAAHCLVRNESGVFTAITPDIVEVSSGDHDPTGMECGENRYKVEEVIVHEWYNPFIEYNDIALLKLKAPGIANWAHEAPICMPTVSSQQRKEDNVVLSGYGHTEFDNKTGPLRYVVLPMMGFFECQYCIGVMTGFDILKDGQLCAGTCRNKTASSCFGDSGGPLIGSQGNAWELVGITSYIIKDCGASPSVLSDVYFYRYWIKRNTPDAVQPLFPDLEPLDVDFF